MIRLGPLSPAALAFDRLKGLGTAVTVAARATDSLAHARLSSDTILCFAGGSRPVTSTDLRCLSFNTIPAMVDSVLLEAWQNRKLIVDIASARRRGFRNLQAPLVFLPNYVPGCRASTPPCPSAEILLCKAVIWITCKKGVLLWI